MWPCLWAARCVRPNAPEAETEQSRQKVLGAPGEVPANQGQEVIHRPAPPPCLPTPQCTSTLAVGVAGGPGHRDCVSHSYLGAQASLTAVSLGSHVRLTGLRLPKAQLYRVNHGSDSLPQGEEGGLGLRSAVRPRRPWERHPDNGTPRRG